MAITLSFGVSFHTLRNEQVCNLLLSSFTPVSVYQRGVGNFSASRLVYV